MGLSFSVKQENWFTYSAFQHLHFRMLRFGGFGGLGLKEARVVKEEKMDFFSPRRSLFPGSLGL